MVGGAAEVGAGSPLGFGCCEFTGGGYRNGVSWSENLGILRGSGGFSGSPILRIFFRKFFWHFFFRMEQMVSSFVYSMIAGFLEFVKL